MRGRRREFSAPLFIYIFKRWKAFKNGMPPTAGGHAQQNPRLMEAFDALDNAEAAAERERKREEEWRRR